MTAPDRPLSKNQDAYRFVRGGNPYAALGRAVQQLAGHPAFAQRPFGSWSRILMGQVNRGHFAFVARGDDVVGFVGWLKAERADAEAWLTDQADVPEERAQHGDCVILNAVQANEPSVLTFVMQNMSTLEDAPFTLYAKRFYADGRVRPLKLNVPAK